MIRQLVLAALLGLFVSVPGEHVLTWRVAKGTTLLRSFESKGSLSLQSIAVTVDGQDQDTGADPEMSVAQSSAYEFADQIEAVADGQPTRLVRKFTKIFSDRVQKFTAPGQDEAESSAELDSELVGKRVAFECEDSKWSAKWAGDETANDDLLEGLQAEVDFRAFLPDKDVAEGDSWEPEASAFENFLRPGGRLSRKTKGEDAAANNRHEAALDDSTDGKAKATYRGIREEDGVQVAVIALTAEITQHSSEESDAGKAGTLETLVDLTFKVEGEILWDVSAGFARAGSLTGTLDMVQTQSRTVEAEGAEHTIKQVLSLSGDLSYKVHIEVQ